MQSSFLLAYTCRSTGKKKVNLLSHVPHYIHVCTFNVLIAKKRQVPVHVTLTATECRFLLCFVRESFGGLRCVVVVLRCDLARGDGSESSQSSQRE